MTHCHVFLSYCRDDRRHVRDLHDDLVKAGFEVWWDAKILGGDDWRQKVREAIQRCFAVVACFSSRVAARDKSGMYPELRDAINIYRSLKPGTAFIIPIRFSACEIPLLEIDATRSLADLQYVDLFPPRQRAKGVEAVIAALKAMPSCP